MLDFLARLQTIDRRWIYLAVAVACTLPFLKPVSIEPYISNETQSFYDTMENVKAINEKIARENEALASQGKPLKREKVVLIDSPWGPGAIGECKGHSQAMFEHMLRNRTKFIVFALDGDPLAPGYTDEIMAELLKKPEFADRKYGVDWVNLGITKTGWQAMMLMAKDFKRQFPKDVKGYSTTDYEKLPIMEYIKDINDVAILACTNYWPNEAYVTFIHEQYKTPLLFGGGGISSTTLYRYLPSGQISGFLVGTRGGAEYDALLHPNPEDRNNLASKLIVPLAYGHLVIILAIVLGNVGYFATQRKRGK